MALLRALSDVTLWAAIRQDERANLFQPRAAENYAPLIAATGEAPELREPFQVFCDLVAAPVSADAAAVADACGVVIVWAEARQFKRVAVQFAEAAARVDPYRSVRAYVAGRLCRRRAEHDRAFLWYERAIRLARRAQVAGEAGAEIDFANAHLGYGNTYVDLDQYTRAEPHFWKAIRAAKRSGRRSLAGAGYHNLLATSAILERWDAAFNYARFAVALYKPGHPRFPVLATDVATLLNRLGYYSSAIPVLEKTLPFLVNQPERILALASLAEAAGAIRDRVRFERAAEHVVRSAQNQDEMSASSLYWVAEGALCFGETDRAIAWATSAIEVARSRQNPVIVELASRLLTRIANGEDGRRDRVPPEGGSVDEICSLVLRKLKKQPPPLPAAPPPEQYPSL